MNTQSIEVHFLPTLVKPQQLSGQTAVPIDILRAGTTITTALANSAVGIVPFETVEETEQFSLPDKSKHVLRGGERGGKLIDGFDLGNSPAEYTPENVAQKTIAFTTTNGTLAIKACEYAKRVLIGAFVNLTAICKELMQSERIALVCAGTRGEMTTEDILFAGAVCSEISKTRQCSISELAANRQTEIAEQMWHVALRQIAQGQTLCDCLKICQGGVDLVAIDSESDIEWAARIDEFKLVPELDLQNWIIQ